jgi:thiamine-phosphate pyrophosphorylase
MGTSSDISGLYAITPDLLDTDALVDATKQVLAGGAQLIQYRNKIADQTLLREQAKQLLKHCRAYGIPLIINDHLEIAIELDADGLHVGQDDISVSTARHQLGRDKIIGVSCYNRLDFATQAQEEGADYVAFGAFYTSVTKLNTVTASIDLLCQAKQKIAVPVVCIGGINLNNAIRLIEHGCDAIAVSNALFQVKAIQSSAQQFSGLFK